MDRLIISCAKTHFLPLVSTRLWFITILVRCLWNFISKLASVEKLFKVFDICTYTLRHTYIHIYFNVSWLRMHDLVLMTLVHLIKHLGCHSCVARSLRIFVLLPEEKRRWLTSTFAPGVDFNVHAVWSSRTFGVRSEGGVPNNKQLLMATTYKWNSNSNSGFILW